MAAGLAAPVDEDGKRRQVGEPLAFIRFIGPQPRPRLQPAFARESQVQRAFRGGFGLGIEINGEHVAHRGAPVFAFAKRLHAAQHEQAATRAR